MLISHTPVRGVILKYFGENHTLCVKFEPNWTRCKQLEEGIKSLACGSWFYPFLSLFANSFNLERYSSRGGQEKPLGWRLGVFLDHHSMNILINTPRSNKILPRVLPKYSRLRLEYFGRTLGSILLLLGGFISNSTIVWFSLKYFRHNVTSSISYRTAHGAHLVWALRHILSRILTDWMINFYVCQHHFDLLSTAYTCQK